jgi:hypothetical protein
MKRIKLKKISYSKLLCTLQKSHQSKMNYLIKQNQKKEIMNIENTKAQMRKVFSSFASYLY